MPSTEKRTPIGTWLWALRGGSVAPTKGLAEVVDQFGDEFGQLGVISLNFGRFRPMLDEFG